MDMRDVAKFITENRGKIVVCSPGCTFAVEEVIFLERDEALILEIGLVIDDAITK